MLRRARPHPSSWRLPARRRHLIELRGADHAHEEDSAEDQKRARDGDTQLRRIGADQRFQQRAEHQRTDTEAHHRHPDDHAALIREPFDACSDRRDIREAHAESREQCRKRRRVPTRYRRSAKPADSPCRAGTPPTLATTRGPLRSCHKPAQDHAGGEGEQRVSIGRDRFAFDHPWSCASGPRKIDQE